MRRKRNFRGYEECVNGGKNRYSCGENKQGFFQASTRKAPELREL
jgi:hypothetical protein